MFTGQLFPLSQEEARRELDEAPDLGSYTHVLPGESFKITTSSPDARFIETDGGVRDRGELRESYTLLREPQLTGDSFAPQWFLEVEGRKHALSLVLLGATPKNPTALVPDKIKQGMWLLGQEVYLEVSPVNARGAFSSQWRRKNWIGFGPILAVEWPWNSSEPTEGDAVGS